MRQQNNKCITAPAAAVVRLDVGGGGAFKSIKERQAGFILRINHSILGVSVSLLVRQIKTSDIN